MKNIWFLFLMMIAIISDVKSQIQISGADCVEASSPTQYILSFRQSRIDSVRVKLVGGHFDNGDSVKYLTYPGPVLIFWDSVAINRIEANLGSSSTVLLVNTISSLISGEVLSDERIQYYDSTKLEYVFHCEMPKGGACQPSYSFQWQVSTDGVLFSNLSGAVGRDLYYSLPVSGTLIFRRITKESQSNTLTMSEESRLIKR